MGLEENLKIHPKLKIVIKASILTAVILISYFIGYGISFLLHLPNNYISSMWCAATVIVVFDDLPLNAKTAMKDRTLGSLVGHVCSSFMHFTHWPPYFIGHYFPFGGMKFYYFF